MMVQLTTATLDTYSNQVLKLLGDRLRTVVLVNIMLDLGKINPESFHFRKFASWPQFESLLKFVFYKAISQ